MKPYKIQFHDGKKCYEIENYRIHGQAADRDYLAMIHLRLVLMKCW